MRHTSPRHSEASHPACYRDSPSGGAGGMREPHVRPNNENKSEPSSTMHEGTTTHKGSTVHEDSGLHDDSIDCIMFELTCSRRIPHSGCWAWLAGGSERKWVVRVMAVLASGSYGQRAGVRHKRGRIDVLLHDHPPEGIA